MRTQLGSEVINQDRRQLLSTATMGIAAAAAASLFPRIRRPLRRVTRSAPSASIFRMKTSQIFTDACWRHAGATRHAVDHVRRREAHTGPGGRGGSGCRSVGKLYRLQFAQAWRARDAG